MSVIKAFENWFQKAINHEVEGARNTGAYWFAWQAAIASMQGDAILY